MAGKEQTPIQESKLLPSQEAFKSLSDRMLELKTNHRISFMHISVNANPSEVLERLQQSSLKDLLLPDGASFSITPTHDHFPDLDIIMGQAPIRSVNITHLDWQDPKWRIDPNGSQEPPYSIIEYPGEFDWTREIELSMWFGKESLAAQKLGVQTGSRNAGLLPSIYRTVYAPDYAETGYEGHNRVGRSFANDEEAMFFINLATELFDKSQ